MGMGAPPPPLAAAAAPFLPTQPLEPALEDTARAATPPAAASPEVESPRGSQDAGSPPLDEPGDPMETDREADEAKDGAGAGADGHGGHDEGDTADGDAAPMEAESEDVDGGSPEEAEDADDAGSRRHEEAPQRPPTRDAFAAPADEEEGEAAHKDGGSDISSQSSEGDRAPDAVVPATPVSRCAQRCFPAAGSHMQCSARQTSVHRHCVR